jgi:GTP 3',8-cyclase
MFDRFNRRINYLRISVTDRCNLRCRYCMPEEGIKLLPHHEILSFDEIVDVIKESVNQGIDKIRITGGEPLVRKGIVELVSMISKIEGIKDFGMTTNGLLLEEYAQALSKAGLQRINISIDTIDPLKYKQITRFGDFEKLKRGIEAAKNAGLSPIKINCVILESHLENDAQAVTEFCRSNNLDIRYIREMDLEKGTFWKVLGGEGGDCSVCNRLRLTSNGKIKPCLFSNLEYDVRQLGIKKALELAIGNKPESGSCNFVNKFSNIGG